MNRILITEKKKPNDNNFYLFNKSNKIVNEHQYDEIKLDNINEIIGDIYIDSDYNYYEFENNNNFKKKIFLKILDNLASFHFISLIIYTLFCIFNIIYTSIFGIDNTILSLLTEISIVITVSIILYINNNLVYEIELIYKNISLLNFISFSVLTIIFYLQTLELNEKNNYLIKYLSNYFNLIGCLLLTFINFCKYIVKLI